MVPMLDPDSNMIKITTNEKGRPVALLSLEYTNSGIDVIDAIRRGEILEHNIIIRDQKGEELGRAPINIIQYEVEEIASNKGEQKILLTNSGSGINLKKSNELPPISRKGKVRLFQNNEVIPQYIELSHQPPENSYVSAYIELTYVKPYMAGVCEDKSLVNKPEDPTYKTDCEEEKIFYQEVENDNNEVIREKETILTQAVSEMKDDSSIPEPYKEKLVFSPKKSATFYKSGIKQRVINKNPKPFKDTEDPHGNFTPNIHGSRYLYREWKLISNPRFFQITTVETPRKELRSVPKYTETDFTHFEPDEKSEVAEVEDVVIEVNKPNDATKDTSKVSPEAKTVSLSTAERKNIGVGSQCIVNLKTGKYFTGKLLRLEGYDSIQVEVNGQPIDVPKKDIELIYFPKSSTLE
jgi:hypothetical protein